MAHVELAGEQVTVRLSPFDKVLSLHGTLQVPLSHITGVEHAPVPAAWFYGFRVGTNIPGVKTAGTFFTRDGTIFYDFHDPSRCLTFHLEHEFYKRVVVEVDQDQDPKALAATIEAARAQSNR